MNAHLVMLLNFQIVSRVQSGAHIQAIASTAATAMLVRCTDGRSVAVDVPATATQRELRSVIA